MLVDGQNNIVTVMLWSKVDPNQTYCKKQKEKKNLRQSTVTVRMWMAVPVSVCYPPGPVPAAAAAHINITSSLIFYLTLAAFPISPAFIVYLKHNSVLSFSFNYSRGYCWCSMPYCQVSGLGLVVLQFNASMRIYMEAIQVQNVFVFCCLCLKIFK